MYHATFKLISLKIVDHNIIIHRFRLDFLEPALLLYSCLPVVDGVVVDASTHKCWVIIVWNNHVVVHNFAPRRIQSSTPFSERCSFVIGSLVIRIVLLGAGGTSSSSSDRSNVAPVASIKRANSLLDGAFFPATPRQMYTNHPPSTPLLVVRANFPFSNVDFIEKLYVFSASVSFKRRKSLVSNTHCSFADCSSQSMLRMLGVLHMHIMSLGVRLSFVVPSLAMTSVGAKEIINGKGTNSRGRTMLTTISTHVLHSMPPR